MRTEWHTASAPGKFVILGEHSVVYGKPAVVLAADRRITCSVRRARRNLLNGEPIEFSKQPHFRFLTRNLRHAVEFSTRSDIPAGAGLGSSAALSAAVALALGDMHGDEPSERELVDEAYGAELAAQGSGSPMDASACVHGGGIGVNLPGSEDRRLWRVSRGDRTWCVSDVKVPDMTFVVGNTGIRAPTGPQVDKVRRFASRSNFAAEMIEEIGNVTLSGYDALRKGDVETLGRMMLIDHKLLSILGVSCKDLNKLVNAALPYSFGAKLTGSGGGGCMVALTDRPEKVAEAIEARGGTAYVMRTGVAGARLEGAMPDSPVFDIPRFSRRPINTYIGDGLQPSMEAYGIVSDLRVWIAGALVLSLLLETVDLPSSELIVITLMIQMTLSMDGLKLSASDIRNDARGAALSIVLCYVVNTAVTLAIGALFIPNHEAMWRGWVLLASMPCAISVVTAALLMKGSVGTAVVAVGTTYICGIALTPLISFALLGSAVNPLEILKYIVLFIAIPALASIPLGKLRLSSRIKVPVIDMMMAVMLFLAVNANRGYMISNPDALVLVAGAVIMRLLALIAISVWIERGLKIGRRSVPVYRVLCVWKNTGLSVSMCMIVLAGTPESVIPCFVCMIVESLWFSLYTSSGKRNAEAIDRRSASASAWRCRG